MSLTVNSQSGELLADARGASLSYLGRAVTYQGSLCVYSPYGPPLIFFNTAEQGGIKCFLVGTSADSQRPGWWYIAVDAVLLSNVNTAVTPTCYCFGPPLPTPTQSQGIIAYDSSGRCVFNSTRSPLRVREYLSLPAVATQAFSASTQRTASLTQAYSTPLVCTTGSFWKQQRGSFSFITSVAHTWIAGGVLYQTPTANPFEYDFDTKNNSTSIQMGAPAEFAILTDLSFYE